MTNYNKLKEIGKLRNDGLISEEKFLSEKKRILNSEKNKSENGINETLSVLDELDLISLKIILKDLLDNGYFGKDFFDKEIELLTDGLKVGDEFIINKYNNLSKIVELKEIGVLEENEFSEELNKLFKITDIEYNKHNLSEKIKLFFEHDYGLRHLTKADISKLNPEYIGEDELNTKFNKLFSGSEMLFGFLSLTYNLVSILLIPSLIIQLPYSIPYIIFKLFLLFLLYGLYLNHKRIMQNIGLQFMEITSSKYEKINIGEYLSFYGGYTILFFFTIIINIILVFYKFSKNEFEIFLFVYFIIFFYIIYGIINQTNSFKLANINTLLKGNKYVWLNKRLSNTSFFLMMAISIIPFITYYFLK